MEISICKFLANYYGISLNAGGCYSHKVVKKHFKFLKTCSFKVAANNANLVKDGKIVYVKDSYGVIFPYLSPDKLLISNKTCDYTENKREEVIDYDILDDLCNLPTYVVHELLSKYKDKPSFYRVIKKELIKRGIYENKLYKLRKEAIKLEESDNNDKYQRRRKIKCKKS